MTVPLKFRSKTAALWNTPVMPPIDPTQHPEYRANEAENDAINTVGKLGLIGLGTGASAASIMAIRDFLTRKSARPPNRRSSNSPVTLEMPSYKTAGTAVPPEAPDVNAYTVAEHPELAKHLAPGLQPKSTVGGLFDALRGKWTEEAMAKPWFLPSAVAATGLGLYGGYQGVHGMLDWRHKVDRAHELENAKNEYRAALAEQYAGNKLAADHTDDLAYQLDALATEVLQEEQGIKQAWNLADVAGTSVGGYLTAAGLLAGTSGLATYAYTKAHSPEARLQKAIEQRERLRWAARPPEIYAVSRPPEEEEEEPQQQLAKPAPLPKLAFDMAAIYRRAIGSVA